MCALTVQHAQVAEITHLVTGMQAAQALTMHTDVARTYKFTAVVMQSAELMPHHNVNCHPSAITCHSARPSTALSLTLYSLVCVCRQTLLSVV